MAPKPPQDAIKDTLNATKIILVKQLSYIADIPIFESRQHLVTYYSSNSSNITPIYMVSGLRMIHNQLSYAFFFTDPTSLDATKSKFHSVTAVQVHGLILSTNPLTHAEITNLIYAAHTTITVGELQLLTQSPILADNALRSNAYSNIINSQVKRKVNAYVASLKVEKSTNVIQGSLFDAPNPSLFSPPSTSTPTSTKETTSNSTTTNATIIQKQNRLSFGTAAAASKTALTDASGSSGSGVKRSSSSIFEQLDDDVSTSTKSSKDKSPFIPKSTTSSASKPTTTAASLKSDTIKEVEEKKAPVKHNPFAASHSTKATTQSASLFDELDNDDFFASRGSKSKAKPTKKATGGDAAKKAQVVIDSESEEDDEYGGLGFNGGMGDYIENDGDDNDELFHAPSKSAKSIMGDSSDDDNDMVKSAKGITSVPKKPTPQVRVEDKPVAKESKHKVIFDEDSDDGDEYAKRSTGPTSGLGTAAAKGDTGFGVLSKKEIEAMEKSAKRAQQFEKASHSESKQPLTFLHTNPNSNTRFNEETGKHQKLVTKTKYETEIDEEGFEVRKPVSFEEWVDYTPAVPKAVPAPTQVPTPDSSKTTPKPKKTAEEKPKPAHGGIMKFFGGGK
jgi:hypothetical protein